MAVGFGDCVFDSETRRLLRGGAPVPLTPKAYALLELLIVKRPAAVSKAEIRERLWPSTFVADVNLAALICEIRKAMADSARHPKYVRTARGFGYAFSGVPRDLGGPVAPASPCRLIWGNREVALAEGENILGRGAEAVLWIDHVSVSRRHARLVVRGATAELQDLGSKNGTFVDGRKVSAPVPLEDGDEIRLGTVATTFRIFRERETTQSGLY
jgi:DNA-binding winged helix-turn-helix (wHTH) protein